MLPYLNCRAGQASGSAKPEVSRRPAGLNIYSITRVVFLVKSLQRTETEDHERTETHGKRSAEAFHVTGDAVLGRRFGV